MVVGSTMIEPRTHVQQWSESLTLTVVVCTIAISIAGFVAVVLPKALSWMLLYPSAEKSDLGIQWRD